MKERIGNAGHCGSSKWVRLLGGAALYMMLLSLHEPIIGVSPFPAWPP